MDYVINNIKVKKPSTFRVERYNITTMERLSDASMVGDLVAKKRKFYFTYDSITAEDFDNILAAIYNSDALFFPFSYPDRDATVTAEVYVGSIPADLHYMSSKNVIWKNLTFNLIER